MDAETGSRPQEIGFILVPGFALMSFASGCESFRAANDLAARPLYRLRYFGEADGHVASSSGAVVPTEALPRQRGHLHTLFVCAGGEPTGWNRPEIHAALRRMARLGVRIGGISGGPYLDSVQGNPPRPWPSPATSEPAPDRGDRDRLRLLERDPFLA